MDLPPSSANRNQDMPTSGPSSEAVTSSEGAQRVDTEEHEADPRPQRLDRRDHSVRLLYHGNCSKCHHFHRHVAFKVKIDEAEHTRFYCERCRHPIFGLGRTDTQNSLASQDSFPINEGVVEVVSALDICSNRPGPLPSLQLNTSSPIQLGTGPLSAILEQSPQGQTRPTFAVSAHTLANSTKVCDPLIATRASRTGQHGVQTGRAVRTSVEKIMKNLRSFGTTSVRLWASWAVEWAMLLTRSGFSDYGCTTELPRII